MANKFRIIGGQWRGRKLNFAEVEDIRPTPDRVRETLFNWLQMQTVGARCLDLFGGSGALSFEALSRGAASATCLEQSSEGARMILSNVKLIGADKLQLINTNTLNWLASANQGEPYDLVFLDPPFASDYYLQCLEALRSNKLIGTGSNIYLEANQNLEMLGLPDHWTLIKNKKAGKVHFGLVKLA